jgi:multidrug efflux pump subunit AcrB
MAAKHTNIPMGVLPNGLEDTPQFKLIIDQETANALGGSINTINDMMTMALAGLYIKDFIDCGRVKKVSVQAEAPFRMFLEDINKWVYLQPQRPDGAILRLLYGEIGTQLTTGNAFIMACYQWKF